MAAANDRLAALRRHVTVLVNQYGVLLRHGSPTAASPAAAAADEARVRAGALALAASAEALLQLVADLRVDDLLLRAGSGAGGAEGADAAAAGGMDVDVDAPGATH
jgi:hypothetical protein